MKITLEFKSKFEHDKYCLDFAKSLESENIHVNVGAGSPITDYTRRKNWSDMEVQFLKDNYMIKKVRWIAKQLRRKPTQVSAKLVYMYNQGLPHKRSKNGEINEQ